MKYKCCFSINAFKIANQFWFSVKITKIFCVLWNFQEKYIHKPMLTIFTGTNRDYLLMHTVSNNAEGRISKRVFQENKTRQIFRKTNIFYLLIRTRIKNIPFSEIWRALFSWNTRFEIRPSALLLTILFTNFLAMNVFET